MSESLKSGQSSASQQWAIDVLVRETSAPPEVIKEMYVIEHTRLERVARIKTFVSVLASRQVKLVLGNTHAHSDTKAAH